MEEQISHCLNAGIAYGRNAMELAVARTTIRLIIEEVYEQGKHVGYALGIGEAKE